MTHEFLGAGQSHANFSFTGPPQEGPIIVEVTFDDNDDITHTVTIERAPAPCATSFPDSGGGCPGDNFNMQLGVTNNASCQHTFGIETSYGAGSASITATPNPSSLPLDPGETGTVDINVDISAGSDPGSSKELIVKVMSEGQTSCTDTATISVPLGSCGVSLSSVAGCPGLTVDLDAVVTNTGFVCTQSYDWILLHDSGDSILSLPIDGTTSPIPPQESEAFTIPVTLGGSPGQFEVVALLLEGADHQLICSTTTTISNCPVLLPIGEDPPQISADSTWGEMPHDFARSVITLQTDPPACAESLELEIVRDPSEPYHPADDTVQSLGGGQWEYKAFKEQEPKDEKHPTVVDVAINVKCGDQVLGAFSIRVTPVWTFFKTQHYEGPGSSSQPPDHDDYWQAYKYIKWKYGDVFDTIGGGFTGEVVDETVDCVDCESFDGDPCDAVACTTGRNVIFSGSLFNGSENRAASIIGHELVHTTQGPMLPSTAECESYCWEYVNRFETGIDVDAYLDEVINNINQVCGHGPEECPTE